MFAATGIHSVIVFVVNGMVLVVNVMITVVIVVVVGMV